MDSQPSKQNQKIKKPKPQKSKKQKKQEKLLAKQMIQKKMASDSESVSESESEDGIDLGMNTGETETVGFNFLEPAKKHSQSIGLMLKKTFSFGVDLGDLVDAVCMQPEMGMLVSTEDDGPSPTVFGVSTFLSFLSLSHNNLFASIKRIVAKKLSEEAEKRLTALSTKPNNLGMFINERVVNMPFSVVPVIFNEMIADFEFIKSDPDYTEAERNEYAFTHVLYFSLFEDVEKKIKQKQKEPNAQPKIEKDRVHYTPEDSRLLAIGEKLGEIMLPQMPGKGVEVIVFKFPEMYKLMKSGKLFEKAR